MLVHGSLKLTDGRGWLLSGGAGQLLVEFFSSDGEAEDGVGLGSRD